MVKHIVMFKLTGTPEERLSVASSFRDALLALPEKIDVLRSIEVGLNQNPAEDWDVVLTAVAAAGLLAGHKDLRACVDYEV